jgi:DNA primase
LFDNDEAGKIGMERAMMKFGKYAALKKATLPSGYKDLDEYLSENSVSDFHSLALAGHNMALEPVGEQEQIGSYRTFSF